MAKGVKIDELLIGGGELAERGRSVRIRYTGSFNKGDVFQRDIETTFVLGARCVIAGLEYGVRGMRVGGRRRIRVSPHLAYRDEGLPGVVPPIPPNAVLIFEIELLESANVG